MFTAQLVRQILDTAPVARLGQLDNVGAAQALPFVFSRLGTSLWSPIDGKPKRSAKLDRLSWLAEHPQVCILVDHYEADWSQLWWLKLFAQAEIVREPHTDWEQVTALLAEKYPQYRDTEMFLDVPTMVRFDYSRWKSWAAAGDVALQRRLSETR